jgi:hypothetical protein
LKGSEGDSGFATYNPFSKLDRPHKAGDAGCYATSTMAALSGNYSPKQRW